MADDDQEEEVRTSRPKGTSRGRLRRLAGMITREDIEAARAEMTAEVEASADETEW